jgi:transposase
MLLTKKDKGEVLWIIKKGDGARIINRAHALNMRDKNLSYIEVADLLELTSRTVSNIEKNYEEGGLKKALYDDPRPGAPVDFDDRIKSKIVAMVCSDPPEGFDRWTLDLIKEKAVENGIVESIGRETVRLILKEHDLKPWKQKSWCVPDLDDEFIERMEDVLDVYAQPYDEKKPVICLDEKPIQLLDDVRPASGIAPGEEKKVDFEYERKGTCNVFCAAEPLAGKYINKVTKQRKRKHFAQFLRSVERQYKTAEKIILIMDNLNTHTAKSLTDFYGEEEGNRIWNHFEIHYTPKHGSWLNQAEIAINMYSRQCLGKTRIPDIETLTKKTKAWNRVINDKQVTIKWSFSTKDARKIFDYSGKN